MVICLCKKGRSPGRRVGGGGWCGETAFVSLLACFVPPCLFHHRHKGLKLPLRGFCPMLMVQMRTSRGGACGVCDLVTALMATGLPVS